jgi:hypothetical protein
MHIEMLRKQAFDVRALQQQLLEAPWNSIQHRTAHPQSPHRDVSDIWVRYNPISNFHGDMQAFNDEHISEWYPIADQLPEAVRIADLLMTEMQGRALGAVLITKIPAWKQVYPHVDRGWHAQHFQKFAVQVRSNRRQAFCFEGEQLVTEPGDLYWFDNTYQHHVINNSTEDRITLIVCIRR